jgi:2,4-dichlorophenol 6-monooxygenase
MYVSADFSRCAPDPDVLIRWIYSLQAKAVLVVMVPVGPDSEDWAIHLNYPVDDPAPSRTSQVEADARCALGIGDVRIRKIRRQVRGAVGRPAGRTTRYR